MERTIDEQRLQELLAQQLSHREIARQLNIPRTTLQRHLGKMSTQHVYKSVPQETASSIDVQDDLTEIIAWWRERKRLAETPPDPERETQRQTYHVEKRYIEAIKREADLEQTSITEIVNRAFQHFFAGR